MPSASGGSSRVLHGYYRNFGIRATPRGVQSAIVAAIDDGNVDWTETEWHGVDPSNLDAGIRSRIEGESCDGIWYRSGRIFYSDEDGER
jgi:hypothetical protein